MAYAAILFAILLFASLVYRYDLYEKEPWYSLAFVFVLTAVGCWGWGYLATEVNEKIVPNAVSNVQLGEAIVAGVGEESLKLLAVLITMLLFAKAFNDPFDGIVYGAFAGIGFALCEAWYNETYSAIGYTAEGAKVYAMPWWNRAAEHFTTVILHTMMGALTCAGLTFAKYKVERWPIVLTVLTLSSMALHTAWDYVVFRMELAQRPDSVIAELQSRQQIVAALIMCVLVCLFGRAVVVGSKSSRRTLGRAKSRTLYGWPFNIFIKKK